MLRLVAPLLVMKYEVELEARRGRWALGALGTVAVLLWRCKQLMPMDAPRAA